MGRLYIVTYLLSVEYPALNCGPVGHGLVRVNPTVGLFSVEVVLEKLLNLGDAGRATHEHDLVHLPRGRGTREETCQIIFLSK